MPTLETWTYGVRLGRDYSASDFRRTVRKSQAVITQELPKTDKLAWFVVQGHRVGLRAIAGLNAVRVCQDTKASVSGGTGHGDKPQQRTSDRRLAGLAEVARQDAEDLTVRQLQADIATPGYVGRVYYDKSGRRCFQ